MNQEQNSQETAQTQVTDQDSSTQQEVPKKVEAPQETQASPPPAKKSKAGVIVLVVIAILAITAAAAGYFFLLYPRQQLEKARTPDQDIKTESTIIGNKTKIEAKGLNSSIVIEPSDNDLISGTVNIKAEDVLETTKHVGFSIIESVDDYGQGGPNLGFDSDPSDGWTKEFDTSTYENGQYYIVIFVFDNDTSSNPTGVTNVKVEIRN